VTLILTDTHFINLDHVESIAWHKDAAYVSFRSGKKEVMYDDAATDLRQRVERIVNGKTSEEGDDDPTQRRAALGGYSSWALRDEPLPRSETTT